MTRHLPARQEIVTDLPDGREPQIPVHPIPQKYIASPFAKISTMHSAVPARSEGRIAIVTNVECGMMQPMLLMPARNAARSI
jgi:hypothetical protein